MPANVAKERITMLTAQGTTLLIVDIQEKLARAMHAREEFIANVQRLVRGARALGLPIVWAEQNPKGLGPTVAEVAELLHGLTPISKFSFSCGASESCMQQLRHIGRRQVLIAGIEAHVCVYQTAAELTLAGFQVEVVADACTSRTPQNKQIGLDKCRASGAAVTSVETALFELLKVAEGPLFKELLNIVK
jgi:nicotinamidase-related amidase